MGNGAWSFVQSARASDPGKMRMCAMEKFKFYLLFGGVHVPFQDHLGSAEFCPASGWIFNKNKNRNLRIKIDEVKK